MKKFGLFAIGLAVLIGCGGGGAGTPAGGSTGGSTGGGTTGGNTGGSTSGGTTGTLAVIPSSQPGRIDLNILPGAGRSPGTMVIDVNEARFGRSGGGSDLVQTLTPVVQVGLDGYGYDSIVTGIGLSPATQAFASMTLKVNKLTLPDATSVTGNVSVTAPFALQASRGRTTTLRVMLDELMFYADAGAIVFDQAQFNSANIDLFDGKIPGFFSDLVRVDIGGVTNRPVLGPGHAKYLYLSGDIFAISDDTADSLEALLNVGRTTELVATRSGSFTGTTSGTYRLDETDPRDPLAVIKRLESGWSSLGSVVQNVGDFLMLSFPSADPTQPDQLLIISKGSNGQINECYVGELNTGTTSFVAYPVRYLGQTPQEMVGGSIVTGGSGGTYTLEFGNAPAGFPGTGSYLRFVR